MFVRPPTKKKAKVNYVDNEEFLKEIRRYKRNGYEGKIPNRIGEIVLLMADRMSKARCFHATTFKQQMIDNAVLTVCRYIDRFDTRRKNPFGYFTSVIYFSFLDTIKKETKLRTARLEHLREQIELFKGQMRESYGSDRAVNRELKALTNNIEELLS